MGSKGLCSLGYSHIVIAGAGTLHQGYEGSIVWIVYLKMLCGQRRYKLICDKQFWLAIGG